jgi:preprotein translocase subunit SecA
VDYKVEEKSRTANLTEAGIKKLKPLGVNNIYEKDLIRFFILSGLKSFNII